MGQRPNRGADVAPGKCSAEGCKAQPHAIYRGETQWAKLNAAP
jgi:hypothetical protein